MGKIKALELFAGVGGASLALRTAGIKTVGYCESNAFSQNVLLYNMKKGRLDKGPIFHDVTKLKKNNVLKQCGPIDLLSAGFPCLGLSSAGSRKGLYGDHRSKLIKHVYRLVNDLRPKYVFLENTPLITKDKNFSSMIAKFRNYGYKCTFYINSASQVNAKHIRMRWFMLCVRNGAPTLKIKRSTTLKTFLNQNVIEKTLPRNKYKNWIRYICHSFGNCVVPAQAYAALKDLSSAHSSNNFGQLTELKHCDRYIPTVAANNGYQQNTTYVKRNIKCAGDSLKIVPPKTTNHKCTTPLLTRPFMRLCIPTPMTTQCSTAIPSMTKRTSGMLGNLVLSNMFRNKDRMKYMLSDKYLAALSGFPQNWLRHPLVQMKK